MISKLSGARRWLAFGSGLGVEIAGSAGAESLRVAAVRVNPKGARVVGELLIPDARHTAAGVWGTEFSAFVRKHGLGHVAAGILLPRRDVIVRTLTLPGVEDADLANAVNYQLDGLHPYSDDDALISWARVAGTPAVLVAITRKEIVERYASLFAEAGVKVAGFTCSAAAVASARRLWGAPAASEVLAFEPSEAGVEFYGESAARPVFSAWFSGDAERAATLAAAEMRLGENAALYTLESLVGLKPTLAACAALMSACPNLSMNVNLLPEEHRAVRSSLAWIPAAALGAAALILVGALLGFPRYGQQRYLDTLNAEAAKIAPAANQSLALDKEIERARRNTAALDELRSRSQADMQVLGELTRLLAAPAWLNSLEVTRAQVNLSGETAQAAGLLSVLDDSPLFQNSEFSSPPVRVANGEAFRIKMNREAGAPSVIAQGGAPQ